MFTNFSEFLTCVKEARFSFRYIWEAIVSLYYDITANPDISVIWNSLMERFGDFIIEGTYSDEAQIDSLGLYTAAATQFENMKRPQFNYSLKTIDWDLLKTSFYDFPEVNVLLYDL